MDKHNVTMYDNGIYFEKPEYKFCRFGNYPYVNNDFLSNSEKLENYCRDAGFKLIFIHRRIHNKSTNKDYMLELHCIMKKIDTKYTVFNKYWCTYNTNLESAKEELCFKILQEIGFII